MSKSLGNLVFVSDLLKTYDARAIRLAIVEHHYREPWEWDDEVMPRAAARLDAWLTSVGQGSDEVVLDRVRDRLDDDLDTPGAVALVDAAAVGHDVTAAAALLGVFLVGDPVT
jgi:L-cysteine:1D-myo-inositol 2-amino-2-deoxy-alpha-D-glucopyranoside ligase